MLTPSSPGSITAPASPASPLSVGSPVAAYWSEAWYRGTVTQLRQLDLAVLFVDYGNTDTVPRDCVRAALEQELVEPPLAVRWVRTGSILYWLHSGTIKFG